MVNNVVAFTVKLGLISFWCEPIFCILHSCCFTVVVNMSNHDNVGTFAIISLLLHVYVGWV